jgi:hypothetical protein
MSGYCQAEGPASILPITYWFPCWWGISPWASPYWSVIVLRRRFE